MTSENKSGGTGRVKQRRESQPKKGVLRWSPLWTTGLLSSWKSSPSHQRPRSWGPAHWFPSSIVKHFHRKTELPCRSKSAYCQKGFLHHISREAPGTNTREMDLRGSLISPGFSNSHGKDVAKKWSIQVVQGHPSLFMLWSTCSSAYPRARQDAGEPHLYLRHNISRLVGNPSAISHYCN